MSNFEALGREESPPLVGETACDAYMAMDSTGSITAWNAQAETMFGWSCREVLGRSLSELILPQRHRADPPWLKKFLDLGPQSNQRIEFTAVHCDGHEFPVELNLWLTPELESIRLNAFIHNVSDRRAAEQKFRGLLESAPDAMVIVNEQGDMVLLNAQTEKMFGYHRQELLGKKVEMLMPEPLRASHQQYRDAYLKDLEVRPMGMGKQLHGRHKDGHAFPVEISLSSLATAGEGILVSSAIRDITVRQETEDRLRQAERLAAVGEMIAGLAHESRNTLQQSQACLELLALKVEAWPDISVLVDDIQKAQDRLHYLYEAVRGYAAPIKLQRETTDIGLLLNETWEKLCQKCQGRRAEFVQQRHARALTCLVDPRAMRHVLYNVLENSLHACADPALIRATWLDADLKGRPALRLVLADNGPGLSAEARKRLFQPFFTTKIQGTGLGLALTRRIVEAHHGVIVVGDSTPCGTEILITLPIDGR